MLYLSSKNSTMFHWQEEFKKRHPLNLIVSALLIITMFARGKGAFIWWSYLIISNWSKSCLIVWEAAPKTKKREASTQCMGIHLHWRYTLRRIANGHSMWTYTGSQCVKSFHNCTSCRHHLCQSLGQWCRFCWCQHLSLLGSYTSVKNAILFAFLVQSENVVLHACVMSSIWQSVKRFYTSCVFCGQYCT